MKSPNPLLTWYRVLAYATGVGLLLLVAVAMPLKYLAEQPTLVEVIGPIHDFLYAGYLLVAVGLWMRSKWNVAFLLGVLVAGTIPFLSFVAERKVVRRETRAAEQGAEKSATEPAETS